MFSVHASILLADVKVHQITLQNGIGRAVKDGNKLCTHIVSNEEYDSTRYKSVVNLCPIFDFIGDQKEANSSSANRNSEFKDKHHDSRDLVNHSELGAIFKHKAECVDGGRTERVVADRHVDVGILVNVANKSVNAFEAAADAPDRALCQPVVSRSVLYLVSNVLEDHSNDGYDC